jgi:hypothetical protein
MSQLSKKRRTGVSSIANDSNHVIDCDGVIHTICSKNTADEISKFAREWRKNKGDSFHDASGPTEKYKRFLLCIVDRIANHHPTFTPEQYDKIRQFFTTWEEDAFGGLMFVHPDESLYKRYHYILQGIYNKIPEMQADGTLPISNSYIIGFIIPSIIRGCEYNPLCRRVHPLHKKLMHPNEKKEGGKSSKRSTRKQSTRKRSTRKRKTRRTHKN